MVHVRPLPSRAMRIARRRIQIAAEKYVGAAGQLPAGIADRLESVSSRADCRLDDGPVQDRAHDVLRHPRAARNDPPSTAPPVSHRPPGAGATRSPPTCRRRPCRWRPAAIACATYVTPPGSGLAPHRASYAVGLRRGDPADGKYDPWIAFERSSSSANSSNGGGRMSRHACITKCPQYGGHFQWSKRKRSLRSAIQKAFARYGANASETEGLTPPRRYCTGSG